VTPKRAPVVEYWVMRVVLHHGRPRTPLAEIATMALVNRGTYAQLPDGSIAEPVEQCSTEHAAHEARERLKRDNPREDYRVIINADV
jgi:hypothetical protein